MQMLNLGGFKQPLWTGPISNVSVAVVQGSRSVKVRATGVTKVASLPHDDVLDDVDTGRGIGSLNFVMGNKINCCGTNMVVGSSSPFRCISIIVALCLLLRPIGCV